MKSVFPGRGLEALWEARNTDPQGVLSDLGHLPVTPQRQVLEGYLHYRNGRVAEALNLLEQALEFLTEPEIWRSRALSCLATVLDALMRYDEAAALLEECMQVSRACGDHVGEVAAVHDIGESVRDGNPKFAAECYEMALELTRRYELPALEAVCLLNLAQVGERLGHPASERTARLQRAERLAQEEWPEISAYARVELITDLLNQGDTSQAETLIEKLPLPSDFFDSEIAGQVGLIRARYLQATGKLEAAIESLEAAREHSRSTDQGQIFHLLSQLYEQAGRLQDALDTARQEIALQRDQLQRNREQTLAALEVWHRTTHLRQVAQEERERAEELHRHLESLQEAHEHIRELSIRDTLTDLHNRQYLIEAGTAALRDTSPTQPAQVALLDVDRFKSVNDTYGHHIGDEVLRHVAHLLREVLPDSDLLARYGGEEFVVIRPPHSAHHSLEQDLTDFAARLKAFPIPTLSEAGQAMTTLHISVSIGVKVTTGNSLSAALHEADLLMYQAKRGGGGRVEVEGKVGCGHPSP